MTQKILTWSFYILFIFTPLFFLPFNNELFEYNKMLLVYGLTFLISGAWLLKMVNEKALIFKRTPLDIPILIFLLSQILSTIFSIDSHTSLWGYYSRSNGGLFSILSYITLYYAFVSNFTKEDLTKFLKALLWGGLVVSLYAIPEHFGVSPSCIILTQSFTASCWVQDVQARVFATLGQPNWLAAYLAMLIPLALYFAITAKTKYSTILYTLFSFLFYLAFTFTYSRGATLGLLAGLGIFIALLFLPSLREKKLSELTSQSFFKPLLKIIIIFLVTNLLFGSVLTRFQLVNQAPTPQAASPSAVTQLEAGGTESGQIRLIVWQGAWEIFKHYPILGSGVETFAYSYYNFRPLSHNLVSEWDFLYNKAHNEYLNYLATTGLVGFLSYLAVIGVFLIWSIQWILKHQDKTARLLTTALLAGYISYLVQNFFGFSVVIIALLFYLFPGFAFVATDSTKTFKAPSSFYSFFSFIYKRPIYTKAIKFILIILTLYLVFSVCKIWYADTLYKRGSDLTDSGNPGRGYNNLFNAVKLNNSEPLYLSDLGYAAANASLGYQETDATLSARLKGEADQYTNIALLESPKNLSLLRTAIRTYYELSLIDPTFTPKLFEVFDKAQKLAPTDPKLNYNRALILSQMDKNPEAIEELKKAIALKPNYREAYFTLGEIYQVQNQKDLAKQQFEIVLKLVPNDPDAIKKLQELEGNQ